MTSVCGGIASGAPTRLAHLEDAIGQHRVDGHRMRAKVVADWNTHPLPGALVAALPPSEGALWRPRTSLPGRAEVGTPFSAITSPETMVAT